MPSKGFNLCVAAALLLLAALPAGGQLLNTTGLPTRTPTVTAARLQTNAYLATSISAKPVLVSVQGPQWCRHQCARGGQPPLPLLELANPSAESGGWH